MSDYVLGLYVWHQSDESQYVDYLCNSSLLKACTEYTNNPIEARTVSMCLVSV